jgi:hypothetical protein
MYETDNHIRTNRRTTWNKDTTLMMDLMNYLR